IAAGVKAYHDLKHDHSRYKPYPQADRLIRFAKSKGIKVRIVSAGWPIKQWDKLWHLGLAKHFENDEVFVTGDSRISGSHVKAPKKRAPFYKKIMKKMRASPRTTIMLGDNEDADITPAKSLGITTIRVKQGKNAHEPSKADVVVRHLGGAHQAIKELLTSK
ncbi:MAG TPA: HAD family hydrolase, partial [Candidatus Norongarragalinales archaeon]|nr:HAD family hydrolase [Candidatus Norongarragalinales archaeon]